MYTPKVYPGFESPSLRLDRHSPLGRRRCVPSQNTKCYRRRRKGLWRLKVGFQSNRRRRKGLWWLKVGFQSNRRRPKGLWRLKRSNKFSLKPQENYSMQTNENQTPQNESPKFFYVYILNCNDGGIYTGCTSNLQERFNRHQKGWVPITKDRIPLRLAWCCSFPDKSRAFEFEQYLKTGSGRAFAKRHLLP